MLSKQLLRQYEAASSANDRSLAANEKALDLLEKQLDREMARNGQLEKQIDGVRLALLPVLAEMRDFLSKQLQEAIRDLAKIEHNNTQVLKAEMERIAQIAGVPKGTTPTVEELLAEARADPARRAALESFMQEAEFADTEINYH